MKVMVYEASSIMQINRWKACTVCV